MLNITWYYRQWLQDGQWPDWKLRSTSMWHCEGTVQSCKAVSTKAEVKLVNSHLGEPVSRYRYSDQATGWKSANEGSIPGRDKIIFFFFYKMSRPSLGLTQLHTWWLHKAHSTGWTDQSVKLVTHSSSTAEFKEIVELYLNSAILPFFPRTGTILPLIGMWNSL